MISLLGRIAVLRSHPAPEPCVIALEGQDIRISFKRNVRCKRMIMRVAKDGSGLVMTLPKRRAVLPTTRCGEPVAVIWIKSFANMGWKSKRYTIGVT